MKMKRKKKENESGDGELFLKWLLGENQGKKTLELCVGE